MSNLRYLAYAALAVLAIASPYAGLPEWTPSLATISALIAVSIMGLNLIFGYCGMLVLGQAAFAAAAAYAGTMIFNAGFPHVLALVCGFVLVLVAARLLARIFIRLPGFYLAIGTLGFAYVTEGLARALPGVTGGASGLVLREHLNFTPGQWYAISVVVLLVALLLMRWILHGKTSRALQLVRQDELAAEVAGINVARLKTWIFTVGAAYSAAGGLILSQYVGVVSPEMAGPTMSLEYLAMTIIGGAGSLLGPVVGSVVIHWLFAVSGAAHEFELLVFGGGFLIVVLFAPRGIVGLIASGVNRLGLGGDRIPVELNSEPPPPEAAPVATGTPRLVATSVTKRFGGLKAVNGISIDARAGEVLGLLGPNGAGKSTLFNLLSGIESANEGSVALEGRDITHEPIHARSRLIGRSFQVPRLIPDMTVLDNLMVRVDQIYPDASEAQRYAFALSQLEMFELGSLAEKPAQEIAIGLHKLIDIARSSIGNLPVVLLDEPGVGLSPEELDRLRDIIGKLRASGTAVVIVDHNIDFILSLADRILVMEQGAAIALGTAEMVMKDRQVQQAYLGTFV